MNCAALAARLDSALDPAPSAWCGLRAVIGLLLAVAVGPAWGVDWTGIYAYEGSFGRTAGGTGVVALYEIRIGAKPVTDCRITIDGFQTDETLLCAAHEEAATLTLRFRSYEDGKSVNRYGVTVYAPGAPLIALHRMPDGTLETSWLALRTLDGGTPPRGRYFVRRR